MDKRIRVTAPDENYREDKSNAIVGMAYVAGCWALLLLGIASVFVVGWICR